MKNAYWSIFTKKEYNVLQFYDHFCTYSLILFLSICTYYGTINIQALIPVLLVEGAVLGKIVFASRIFKKESEEVEKVYLEILTFNFYIPCAVYILFGLFCYLYGTFLSMVFFFICLIIIITSMVLGFRYLTIIERRTDEHEH